MKKPLNENPGMIYQYRNSGKIPDEILGGNPGDIFEEITREMFIYLNSKENPGRNPERTL